MPGLFPGYNYDIFICYRQKDIIQSGYANKTFSIFLHKVNNRETLKPKKFVILIILVFLQALVCLSFIDNDDFFTIILLPDTQHYTSSYPEMIYKQMNWIVENKNLLNIQYVVHLGDITNNNKESAWEVGDNSFKILENAGIPYSIVYGDNDMKNPDKNYYDGIRHTEFLHKYFPVTRFDKPGSWWSGGFCNPDEIDNYYCLFSYKEYNYLIMNLELAPRSSVLKWADNVISRYASRKVILVTHDYLNRNGKWLDDLSTFGMAGKDDNGKLKGNNAETVFKKLVKKNPNVILVLCGHKEGTYQNEVRIEGSATRKVFEILSDFQDEKIKGSDEKSGKGLLRILKFYPEKNEIGISTVSALTGKTKEQEIHLSY